MKTMLIECDILQQDDCVINMTTKEQGYSVFDIHQLYRKKSKLHIYRP